MTDPTVPIEYFMSASDKSLENFEMNRLNAAANLEKEIKAMQVEAQLLREAAGVARFLIDHRAEILRTVGNHLERISDISDAA